VLRRSLYDSIRKGKIDPGNQILLVIEQLICGIICPQSECRGLLTRVLYLK
jgi:hypothetical protein